MICKHCGATIPELALSCPECGADVNDEMLLQNKIKMKPIILRADTAQDVVFYVKKRFAIISGIGLVALLALIIGLSTLISFLNRADLTQYISFTAEGFDGRGTVTYSIDGEALANKIFGKSRDELEDDDAKTCRTLINLLQERITIEGNAWNASNGDVITVSINDLEYISEETGIKFKKNTTVEYTVNKLKEATSVSISDLLEAAFVGYDGAGCVELSFKDSDSLPFTLSGEENRIYIDDSGWYSSTYYEFDTSGNEGALSNGDSFIVNVANNPETEEYLLDNYGMYLDTEDSIFFEVSGLQTSETLDVFSLLNVSVSGIDGDARLSYKWDSLDMRQGNLHVTVYNEDSQDFSVYSTVTTPYASLYFANDYSNEEESFIANISIVPSKSKGISVGDSISLELAGYYSDEVIDTQTYAQSGLVFKDTSYTLEVDGTMVSRYITSDAQITLDLLKALAEAKKDSVQEYLLGNWSRIVHGNSSFTCYDQEVVSGPTPYQAYFAKTNTNSNTYTIWIPFKCTCKDSELPAGKEIIILASVKEPIISGGDSQGITSMRDVEFTAYETQEDMLDARWYTSVDEIRYFSFE